MTNFRDPDGPDNDIDISIASGQLPSPLAHPLLRPRKLADLFDFDDSPRPALARAPRPADIDDLPFWEVPARETDSWPPGATSGQSFRRDFERYAWESGHGQAQEAVIAVPRPSRLMVTVREVVETLLLAMLIFLAVRASFQNFRVEGVSMHPSLENGEYLIVNKLAYATIDLSMFDFLPFFDAGDNPVTHLWGEPERGDVIVFVAPTSPERDFIKRIIGVPGDTIEIDEEGRVVVNGAVLEESYIDGTTSCSRYPCTKVIPEKGTAESRAECGSGACYFVMGDNRQNSSDSRQGWLVPEENIIGKAFITYWHDGEPELDLAPNHSVSANDPSED